MYTELKNPDKIDLLNTPFGGRYCGRISPRLRISLHTVTAIVFYTDVNATTPELFRGTFKFINECKSFMTILQRSVISKKFRNKIKFSLKLNTMWERAEQRTIVVI